MNTLSFAEQELAIAHVTNELIRLRGVPWTNFPAVYMRYRAVEILWGRSVAIPRHMARGLVACITESFYRFCDAYALFGLDVRRAQNEGPTPAHSTLWTSLHDEIKALYFRAVAPQSSEDRRPPVALPPQLPPTFIREFVAQVIRASETPAGASVAPVAPSKASTGTSFLQIPVAGPSSGINVSASSSRGSAATTNYSYASNEEWTNFLRHVAYHSPGPAN